MGGVITTLTRGMNVLSLADLLSFHASGRLVWQQAVYLLAVSSQCGVLLFAIQSDISRGLYSEVPSTQTNVGHLTRVLLAVKLAGTLLWLNV